LLNEAKLKLFARYDPFIKSAPLHRQTYDEGSGGILTVRPVWIIGDLIVLTDWFESDLRKSNWQLNQRRMSILQHYKKILLSDDTQSFMVEQNGVAVMQFDLLPGQQTDYPGQIRFDKMDFIIQYLYKESFRDPEIFKRGLQFMISFIFTYPEIGHLYLRLPKAETSTQELLIQTGFELADLHNFLGKSLNIYRIDQSGI
jgi:hypothetical protein